MSARDDYVRGDISYIQFDRMCDEIDRLRGVLALVDTACFLHLGPGHESLHDDKGEVMAWVAAGEHELWVRLDALDALERIEAALAATAAIDNESTA